MAREKTLDKKVMSFIKTQGGWCLKYWGGAKYTKNGIPDILACVNGHFFGIEDKATTGKPTLLQIKNLEWIRKANGFGILLYPSDFNNFTRFIKELRSDDILTTWQCEWYFKNIDLQNDWKEKLQNI